MSGRERRHAEAHRRRAGELHRRAEDHRRRAEEAEWNEAVRLRKERDELREANKRLSRGYDEYEEANKRLCRSYDVPKLQVNQHVTNFYVEQHVHVNPRPPQPQPHPPQPQFYASAIKSGAARGRRARGFEHGDRAVITNNLRGEQGTTGTVTRVTACQVTITDDRGNEYTRNFQNMRKIP